MLSQIQKAMKKKSPPPQKAGPPPPPVVRPSTPLYLKEIDKLMGSNEKYEVEISFGKFLGRGFVPGVSQGEFEALTEILKSQGTVKTTKDTVEIDESSRIRKIVDEDGSVLWNKKIRSPDKVENRRWGYRVASSEEENVEKPNNFKSNKRRVRRRSTFTLGEFPSLQFDLTQVISDDTRITYEVEIERIKIPKSKKEIEDAIGLVLLGLAGKKYGDDTNLLDMDERRKVVALHNKLFERDKYVRPSKDEYHLIEGYWNKPQNIKKDDILVNSSYDFYTTVKLDGKRKFLYILHGKIYVCSPPYDIKIAFFDAGLSSYDYTLLDAEEIIQHERSLYYVFDILFYKGQDMRQESFKERKGIFETNVKAIREIMEGVGGVFKTGVDIFAKNFYKSENFYKMTTKAYDEMVEGTFESHIIKTDGEIFQSGGVYKNKDTKKWKPPKKLTIDFQLKKESDCIFNLNVAKYEGQKRSMVPFRGSKKFPITSAQIKVSSDKFDVNLDGVVAEVKYDAKTETFHIDRLREDKAGVPNEINVAASVWDDIMDPILPSTILGKDLVIMRRFHNLCKGVYLDQNLKKGDVIMDWGSGRGGDIGKWNKIGLSKVYVVEPNKENYGILEGRLGHMNNKVDIVPVKSSSGKLVGGEDTTSLLKTLGGIEPKAIVSFFSLTFFGKDKETFENGVNSISSVLKNKGDIFFGIVMDGVKVKEILDEDGKYSSSAFKIEKVSDFSDKPKKGRNEIKIKIKDAKSMVDYNEWLFYFDLFRDLLEKNGFELVETYFLDSESANSPKINLQGKDHTIGALYDNLSSKSKVFSSLNRYFSFRRISSSGTTLKVSPKSPKSPKKESPKKRESPKSPKVSPKKSPTPDDIKKIKVLNDNFYHAFLQSFDKKYMKMSKKEKIQRVEKLMKMLAEQLDFDAFKTLAGGCVFKSEINVLLDDGGDDSSLIDEDDAMSLEKEAYNNFLETLESDVDMDYRKILSYLSELIGIGIEVRKYKSSSTHKVYKSKGIYKKNVYMEDRKGKIKILSKNGKTVFLGNQL